MTEAEAQKETSNTTSSDTGIMSKIGLQNKVTEKSNLFSAEKKFGVTWDELHAYKEHMSLPALPINMPRELIPTNISMCEVPFKGLDRCIEQGIRTERENYPYERLQICKPFWSKFAKCFRRRDIKIIEAVQRWERDHYEKMTPEFQQEYVNDIRVRRRYQEYAFNNTDDVYKKFFHKREARHLTERSEKLHIEKETRPENMRAG